MNTDADYFPVLLAQLHHADPATSIRLLTAAADVHALDSRPLVLLAAEFAQGRDMDRAEAAYVAALQRAPDFWIARFQLGLLQFTSARPAVAFVTWAPLDSLDGSHPLRLFKRAFECLAADGFDRATELLRMGIAANTDNPPLNHDMRMLIERIAQQQAGGNQPARPNEPAEPLADAHFLVSTYRNLH